MEIQMEDTQTFKIYDAEYETTFTAHIQRNGDGWVGWIDEHPKVKCENSSREVLLKTLEKTLFETLDADWDAWDKQLASDVKEGKLDQLVDKVLEELRAGKCTDL